MFNLPATLRHLHSFRPHRPSASSLVGPLLISLAGAAGAQLMFSDPDWKETPVPPPPAFDTKRLVPVEMPAYSRLQVGVDAATLKVTGDGVVRYVVVASSADGAQNAFYEGLRCATDELKQYARFSDGAWQPVESPEWKRIDTSTLRYAKELARQGVCRGRAPRDSTVDMVRELRNPDRY